MLSDDVISDLKNEKKGYSLDLKLSVDDLNLLRECIKEQWLGVIKKYLPEKVEEFKKIGIENYHELSYLLSHDKIWPKLERILPSHSLAKIQDSDFMKSLKSVFGAFTISDEENVGREEIYWRLVRPHEPNDVGPMHADCWFWDLGHGKTPENTQRVKIWIPIYCEPGLNGLNIVPGSHVRDWVYTGELRDGYLKPQFDQSQVDLPVILPKTNPGEAIIFNDRLLHKGVLNNGQRTRVSIEFTMFVEKHRLDFYGN